MLIALAAAPAAACGLSGPAHRAGRRPGGAVVEISGFFFEPAALEVRVGETVEWRNVSFFTHTVACDAAKAKIPGHVALPAGAAPFDSGRIPAGRIWRRAFDRPGIYRYVCLPHEDIDMLGAVVVSA